MGKAHAIVVPVPAQGHVIPMLELSQWLAINGARVTFVNTEFNHERVNKSLSDSDSLQQLVTMVSIPDGLGPQDDRNDLGKLMEAALRVMPSELEALVENIMKEEEEGGKGICVISDGSMTWPLDVADKVGVRRAAFWPAAAVTMAVSTFNIPKLVTDGIVDTDGRVLKNEMIRMSPTIPAISSSNLVWASIGDRPTQKLFFELFSKANDTIKPTDWLMCNSSRDLEPGTLSMFPNILPVGPLLASRRLGKSSGHFWPEDNSCLKWLDRQPVNSVIYVAFGSITVLDRAQFIELALGLELTKRPFLWVVREGIMSGLGGMYPEGFEERVSERGLMVGWAPQQLVLSHPSVACFVSHCGWNSTVEGVGNGVPFVCWPYFADQFANEVYICDEWKVGVRVRKDENGVVGRGEIKGKLEQVLSDESYKEKALRLQEKTKESVEGGESHENLNKFIEWIIKDE